MKYPYEQIPDYCWFNSVPYFEKSRRERENLGERLADKSSGCLKIGDLAPDFSLEGVLAGERTKVNLREQRGRWTIVFFYPSDFTFV